MTRTTDELAHYEAVIEPDPAAFAVVGLALDQINQRKLYYPHPNFEAYCSERWNLHGRRCYQFVVSARATAEMAAAGHPAPTNEFQARTLARVPDAIRAQVWLRALAISGGNPSAAAIGSARASIEFDNRLDGAAEPAADIPADAGIRRAPQRSQRRAITAGISSLQGLCDGFQQIQAIDPAINAEEAAQWVRDLSKTLRVLRSLTNKLKDHAHANH